MECKCASVTMYTSQYFYFILQSQQSMDMLVQMKGVGRMTGVPRLIAMHSISTPDAIVCNSSKTMILRLFVFVFLFFFGLFFF